MAEPLLLLAKRIKQLEAQVKALSRKDARRSPKSKELTIATGEVDVQDRAYYKLHPETGTTDDLDTINGGQDGYLVAIQLAESGDTITLKDGTGNLDLSGDQVLDSVDDVVFLIYNATQSKWNQVGVSHSAGGVDADTLDGHPITDFLLIADYFDYIFDDTEGDPSSVSTTTADGTSLFSARRDHVHDLADNVVTTTKILDSNVTYAKIQNVTALRLLGSVAGGVVSEIPVTAFGLSLIDDADAATARTTLELGTIATQAENLYALLAGRSGGQHLRGGTGASENLQLESTAHATKGKIIIGSSGNTAYDGVNERLGIGTNAPAAKLHLVDSANEILRIESTTSGGDPFLSIHSLNTGRIGFIQGIDAATEEMRLAADEGIITFLSNNTGGGLAERGRFEDTRLLLGAGIYLQADQAIARSSSGLTLLDDAGNYGIYINDGGFVTVGTSSTALSLLTVEAAGGLDSATPPIITIRNTTSGTFNAAEQNQGSLDFYTNDGGRVKGAVRLENLNTTFGTALLALYSDGAGLGSGLGFYKHLALLGTGYTEMKAGQSTGLGVRLGGVLFSGFSSTGNVGAGEDTLSSYVIAANMLATNGDSIWFEVSGTVVASADMKFIRIRFGSSGTNIVLEDIVSGGVATRDWVVRGRIIRTGASTQRAYTFGGFFVPDLTTSLNQDTTASITISVTGEAVNNNDIVCTSFIVGWYPNNT